MANPLTISGLRAELDLTLQQMGERIGLSKSQMHEVESTGRASLRVAVALEELSGGRIDAAAICDDVKLARVAVVSHGLESNPAGADLSPGKGGEISRSDLGEAA